MNFDDGAKLPLRSADYDRSGALELIESTNPATAECVLHVNDEISDRPGYSWDTESYWYVAETTSFDDEFNSWALFTISWDDNWGYWKRNVEGGVTGSLTKDEAVKLLMKKYYQDCNFEPDDDFWSSLFKPFLD
jgi:hypothetical protein